MAEVVSRPQYINTQKEVILGRMLGDYDYGDGRKEKDPNYMTFFVRNTNFPWKSHGVWWLSQFRRWGMVKEAPDYKGLVNEVLRPELLREVAKEMSIAMPKDRHEEGDIVRRYRVRSGQARGICQEICDQQHCVEVQNDQTLRSRRDDSSLSWVSASCCSSGR